MAFRYYCFFECELGKFYLDKTEERETEKFICKHTSDSRAPGLNYEFITGSEAHVVDLEAARIHPSRVRCGDLKFGFNSCD
jgi:hypothetical protein